MAGHRPINGTTAIPLRRSRQRLSLLEQLKDCQDAWCPGAPWDREGAHAAIQGTPAGSFLVVRGSAVTSQASLLCVSAGETEAVLDYNITSRSKVFQLSDSRLSFSDLSQLVLFYSLSRDVLALCLSIPRRICSISGTSQDRLSQLDPKTWLNPAADEMTQTEPNTAMCSIQLTSTNGALCIINPLYVHEHGDDWLTNQASGATQSPKYKRERRLSTTRAWSGAGLQNKRAISLDQESSADSENNTGLNRAKSADYPPTSSTSTVPVGVVLRRTSQYSSSTPPDRDSTGSSSPSVLMSMDSTAPELQLRGSPVLLSPHRVSWIEDGVWLPPPRPSSLLHPPSLELDSLSISSIEEEQEYQPPSPTPRPQSSHRLTDKVIYRLSAVGQALSGLVCPKKRLTNRVLELSERKGVTFAEAVKEFLEMTKKRGTDPGEVTGSEFLQEVRSSMTSLRETLLDYPEIQALLDSITDLNESEIDSLVEFSLHKVALKPVATLLYSYIHTSRTKDGTLQRLQTNLHVLEENGVEGLGGSAGVGVPNSEILAQIQQRWTTMHEAYSPEKKVKILLKVCKSIYHSMSANASSATVGFGADDFLPCLTWVLLRSDLVTLQLDIDYMMELLDPTQLQGEGGYYLTTQYAALYYISSFQPRLAARQLSIEAQHSLNQWHRRRTRHCNKSRCSKRRQTISWQRGLQVAETDSQNKEESGEEQVSIDEPPQQTESSTKTLQLLEEEDTDS